MRSTFHLRRREREYGLGSVGSRYTVKKTGYEYARSVGLNRNEREGEGEHLRAQVARYGASESAVATVSRPGEGAVKREGRRAAPRSRREAEQLRRRKKGRRGRAAGEKDRREKREPRDIQRENTEVLAHGAGLPVSTTSWSALFILSSSAQPLRIVGCLHVHTIEDPRLARCRVEAIGPRGLTRLYWRSVRTSCARIVVVVVDRFPPPPHPPRYAGCQSHGEIRLVAAESDLRTVRASIQEDLLGGSG